MYNTKRYILNSVLKRAIQREFTLWKALTPLLLCTWAIAAKHLFNGAVKTLCKPISLRVIGCWKSYTCPHEFKQLLPKTWREFHVPIRNYLFRNPILAHPMFKEQPGSIQSSTRCTTRDKTCNPAKTINNWKDCIKSSGTSWKLYHEIHCNMFER